MIDNALPKSPRAVIIRVYIQYSDSAKTALILGTRYSVKN